MHKKVFSLKLKCVKKVNKTLQKYSEYMRTTHYCETDFLGFASNTSTEVVFEQ